MATSRNWKHFVDSFCYVCGFYIGLKQIMNKIRLDSKSSFAYKKYFGMKLGNQDKPLVRHVIWHLQIKSGRVAKERPSVHALCHSSNLERTKKSLQ